MPSSDIEIFPVVKFSVRSVNSFGVNHHLLAAIQVLSVTFALSLSHFKSFSLSFTFIFSLLLYVLIIIFLTI